MIADATRVVVVGAGHGGTAAAALLRQHGFPGPLTLIGAERHAPYHRPPLSKVCAPQGSVTPDLLRPEVFYGDQRIDLRLDVRVHSLDVRERCLHLRDGDVLPYDIVVLAVGARPRRLAVPGADLPGVHTLRTVDDACGLTEHFGSGHRLVVVGGGYIGLEVAAMAIRTGVRVTVLEAAARVLGRSASPDLAGWLTERHRGQGTEVVLGAAVEGFVAGSDGRVAAVVLAGGDEVPCDTVLVGAGAEPCVELAVEAGLRCEGGVVVDEHARTSAEGVYAIGDMTRRPVSPYPGLHRLESIPSSAEQARQVVSHILGLTGPRPEVPWFWSDQFDLKVKIAGLPHLAERSVVRGTADGRFAVFHLDAGGRVTAVETVNAPGEFMAGRKWIAEGSVVDPAGLADGATSLRTLAPGGAA